MIVPFSAEVATVLPSYTIYYFAPSLERKPRIWVFNAWLLWSALPFWQACCGSQVYFCFLHWISMPHCTHPPVARHLDWWILGNILVHFIYLMHISVYPCWSELPVHVFDFKTEVPGDRMYNSAGPSLQMEPLRVRGCLVLFWGDTPFAGTCGLDWARRPQWISESFAP